MFSPAAAARPHKPAAPARVLTRLVAALCTACFLLGVCVVNRYWEVPELPDCGTKVNSDNPWAVMNQVSQTREVIMYGLYRPSQGSLSERHKGWLRMWWNYAQRSVLADVHRRLRKTSWSYLGQRLNCRRKYVNFYRMKLELLQKGQLVGEDILQELENMDREGDIGDILHYRTIAEQQLQEALVKSTKDNFSSPGSPRTDEQSAGAGQGWFKWISRGILGAGGTTDTNSVEEVE